jgi:hypothetical protein
MPAQENWRPSTVQEGVTAWRQHRPLMEAKGIVMPYTLGYVSQDMRDEPDRAEALAMDALGSSMLGRIGHNGGPPLGMDAMPPLFTDANSAIPAIFTTLVDPDVFRILLAPNKATEAITEQKKGTWLDDVAIFPVVEPTGEVSSYGDFNNNGNAGINTGFPQRQNYIFQLVKEYGERESERGSLAKINWVSEIDRAAALTIQKFFNFSYLFGIAGLYNYGLANDPLLSAALTPAPKAAGGVAWVAGGVIKATANEIYQDIQALWYQLVQQTAGLIEQDDEVVLALSPGSSIGMTATNSFGVNVNDLLKKNFPNIKIVTIPQYGARSAANPQGVATGEFVQMIAKEVDGQKSAYCAYSEKQRSHPIIRQESSYRQKLSAGTWGSILRLPAAIVQMVGV